MGFFTQESVIYSQSWQSRTFSFSKHKFVRIAVIMVHLKLRLFFPANNVNGIQLILMHTISIDLGLLV